MTKSNPTISVSLHSSLAFSWCCGPTSPTLPSLNSAMMTLQPLGLLQTNNPTFPYLRTWLKKTALPKPSLLLLLPWALPPPLSRKESFNGFGRQNGELVFPSSLLVLASFLPSLPVCTPWGLYRSSPMSVTHSSCSGLWRTLPWVQQDIWLYQCGRPHVWPQTNVELHWRTSPWRCRTTLCSFCLISKVLNLTLNFIWLLVKLHEN